MPKVFLSYRRDDTPHQAERIDSLLHSLQDFSAIRDIEDLTHSQDLLLVLDQTLAGCDVLLVIIGSRWLQDHTGRHRLDQPDDWVRQEIEQGLQKPNLWVIPVLVNGASMPAKDDLPASMAKLANLQPFVLNDDPLFERDLDGLAAKIRQFLRTQQSRKKQNSDRVWQMVGAVLIVGLVVTLILSMLNQRSGDQPPTPTTLPSQASQNKPEDATPKPTDSTISSTTESPDNALAPIITPTFAAAHYTPGGDSAPITTNAAWTPILAEFEGTEMVLVPHGCFMMGSEDRDEDEMPIHEQCFEAPFWIDRTEVTREAYQACIDDGECTETPLSATSDQATQPINRVTWFQARDYCAWRGMRLPTEAEWEYAARGPDNLTYAWGDEFTAENAVYSKNSGGTAAVVGSRPSGVSWVGALDLNGNLWEWMSTIYGVRDSKDDLTRVFQYPYDSTDGREADGDDIANARVLRGGSFFTTNDLRATNRYAGFPEHVNFEYGFRCAQAFE